MDSSKSDSIELDSIFDDINVNLPDDSFYKPQIISEYELLTLMDDTFSTLSNWYLKLKSDGLVLVGTCSSQPVETAYVARARNKNIQTVDGKCWLLKGEMDMVQMLISGEPNLEQFQNGFPSNWKEIISEMRDRVVKNTNERSALEEVDMELDSDDETTVKKIKEQLKNKAGDSCNTLEQNPIGTEKLDGLLKESKAEYINGSLKPGLDRMQSETTLADDSIGKSKSHDFGDSYSDEFVGESQSHKSKIEAEFNQSIGETESNGIWKTKPKSETLPDSNKSNCQISEEIVSEGTTHFEQQPEERDDLVQAIKLPRKKSRKKTLEKDEKHVYMSPPRSAHESVKGSDESLPKRNNSDSEDGLLKSTTKKTKRPRKPKSVPTTPFKSRSGRTIIKPLQYWKNEKANLTIVDEQGEKQFQLVVLK